MKNWYEFTLEINGHEVLARADYTQYRKEYGSREAGTGLQMEPDIEAHCEIDKLEWQPNGQWEELVLPDALVREIEAEIQGEYE